MAKRTRDSWPERRRRAVQLAETLAASMANGPPVNLRQLSLRRSVRRIEFAPLLTDGGLALQSDGFTVYVRCGVGEAADLTSRFADDGTGMTLPRSIVTRARFTIAHEIAHTFFYDLETTPPRPTIQVDDPISAKKLELACNQIAGLILLPERLLEQYFATGDCVQPEQLRKLADTAIVSNEAVVRRFHHLRQLAHPEAILVSTHRQDNEWIITAISRHYSLRNIFTNIKVGTSISALIHEPDFALFGGEIRESEVKYIGHGGRPMKMQFKCEIGSILRKNRPIFVVGTPISR